MGLSDLINGAKDLFFDAIGKASKAFPGASHLMHVGMIGALPYAAGRYIANKAGLGKYSAIAGFASAAAAEMLWRFGIEPSSPYDHPEAGLYDWIGTGETFAGAAGAHYVTKSTKKK